jgi:hypothetical protein
MDPDRLILRRGLKPKPEPVNPAEVKTVMVHSHRFAKGGTLTHDQRVALFMEERRVARAAHPIPVRPPTEEELAAGYESRHHEVFLQLLAEERELMKSSTGFPIRLLITVVAVVVGLVLTKIFLPYL